MRRTALLVGVCVLFTACGKRSATTTSGDEPSAVPVQLSASTESCGAVSALTANSAPVELVGYALGATYRIDGLTVTYELNGDSELVGTRDIPFGTYCTVHTSGSLLTGVTMSATPGCAPGWGAVCD